MRILGISAFYHDSAACIIEDGEIVAAAQEERFTRKKHDDSFPLNSIAYCNLISISGQKTIDAIAFYDKPITKFSRLISTYQSVGWKGVRSFLKAVPVWGRQKLWIPFEIEKGLNNLGIACPKELFFVEHHESHGASAFFPSPFSSAAIIVMDAVGEWATTSIGIGKDNTMEFVKELRFPHSLGMLYSAFTYYCGFKVNSGEYKLMGLAPYGQPSYVKQIRDYLLDLKDDGSFTLNMKYFDYMGGLRMTNQAFDKIFGGQPRKPETNITQREADLAASIQQVTEDIVLKTCNHARKITGEKDVCLAGGVALNCVANGKLFAEKVFNRIWIQPAAGDAGGALGCASYVWHQIQGNPRIPRVNDQMNGSYLGPSFETDEITCYLKQNNFPYLHLQKKDGWASHIAKLLADGCVIGLHVGRMEFGPRALGHRSILGDPRSKTMQSIMNLKIKFRESFRPFAPITLADKVGENFDFSGESPYMLLVAPIKNTIRTEINSSNQDVNDLTAWVNESRSQLPAITHIDYSARIQTVTLERNPEMHAILTSFDEITGCSVLINTSFNVRGEPIVCTPEDSYRCFMRTNMDYLVLEECILDKKNQPKFEEESDWRQSYVLD